ncbi:MAG TPA: UDP-N-acetylglucosamine 1-carboxyvinyltransferase [Acidimicrobiia bacterium]|jgi:UDP-N-acetylglucosamine 1-carboxyvinyltransferase|nr:UDP-N-acetylglucosamine 1-carboxyvinyltransferase [Acidimicrobiia bacterium]
MDRYVVQPGAPLSGSTRVSGMTKNAGLKQMAAALLAPGVTTLRNMTPVADLDVMADLLEAIGARVERRDDVVRIDTAAELTPEAPYEHVRRMRASINVLGPLLARYGRARVAMPGGDNIGSRKLDMHFGALTAMGAELDVRGGFIEARCNALGGTRVVLDFPSVGATETVLTTAVLAKGETVIDNAAREPEVADLCCQLQEMGANVEGVGTATLRVEGVTELTPTDRAIVGDRIEAGTLLFATAIAGGDVVVEGVPFVHLETVARKLAAMGVTVTPAPDGIAVGADGRPGPVDVQTLPFPGFATDFMPLAVAALTTSTGTAIVTENVFDHRFAFVGELNRMGADVRTEGRHAIVRGVPRLSGAPVRVPDVRAGAALLLAGLGADGPTTVFDTHHVERGYADLPARLRALGADVTRESEPPREDLRDWRRWQ